MQRINFNRLGNTLFGKVSNSNIQNNTTKTHNILLCDSSGSMEKYWKEISQSWNQNVHRLDGDVKIILFDNNTQIYNGRKLPLNMVISGRTNIINGLNKLKEEIKNNNDKELIRVFFITDGDDDDMSSFESRLQDCMNSYEKSNSTVEVYIFGLSKNAPTSMSQKVRSVIHTGRDSIPTFFWYEDNTSYFYRHNLSQDQINIQQDHIAKEFNDIFDNTKSQKLELLFDCNVVPYEKTNEIYTNEWISVDESELEKLQLSYDLEISNQSNIYDLMEMFKQWINILQFKCLKTKDDEGNKKYAKIIETEMSRLYALYKNLVSNQNDNVGKTYSQRLLQKQSKTIQLQYEQLLKIATEIANGQKLKFLNNIELAKQLKSVYVGKYTEKAFKLHGHTDEEFNKDKNNFIDILRKELPNLEKLNYEERCMITLDNTVDNLKDESFISSLENTETKIDFLQNFGITGNAVLLNINDALLMNPWSARVKSLSTNVPTLSTMAIENYIEEDNSELTQNEKDNYVVSIKSNDKLEKINCVIPLFDENTAATLSPIIRSRLFQSVFTFSIQKSAITLNYDAHLGAMSGLFGYLLNSSLTEYTRSIINKISSTSKIYVDARQSLQNCINTLWSNPSRGVITQVEDEDVKCETITKALLMILVSFKDKTPEQISNTMYHIWKEYIGRLVSNRVDIEKLFSITNQNIFDEIEIPKLDDIYVHEYSLLKSQKHVENVLLDSIKFDRHDEINLKLNYDELKKLCDNSKVGNLTWNGLLQFNEMVGFTIDDDIILQFVVHALINTDSNHRNSNVISLQESNKYINNEMTRLKFIEFRNCVIKHFNNDVKDKYLTRLNEEHLIVIPLSKREIILRANEKGIPVNYFNFDKYYKINPANLLLSNACLAEKCPYYLVPRDDFGNHMDSITQLDNFIPGYHKCIYENKESDIIDIISNIECGKCRPREFKNNSVDIKGDLDLLKRNIKNNITKYNQIENNQYNQNNLELTN